MAEKNRLSCGGLSVNEVQGDWSVNDKNNPAYVKNRPFYESEKLIVSSDDWDYVFVKVAGADIANEIYENDDILKVYATYIPVDGEITTSSGMRPHIELIGNDNRLIGLYLSVDAFFGIRAMITFEDNVDFYGITFPEAGIYFFYAKDDIEGTHYVSGLGKVSTDTPDIVTWDGNFSDIKKIDEKFLPDTPNGTMIVNISMDESENYVADKTYQEIFEAHKSGMQIVALIGNVMLYLSYCLGEEAPYDMDRDIQFNGTYYIDGEVGVNFYILQISPRNIITYSSHYIKFNDES